ncbi:hypothetical protein SAMN05444365_103212 [Micromonospora pattaloongensis]|uniref:DUF4350 domain-containing protein n=1 Tax=Micromonospora pattaloongensis TaxID=405436 RepID=A0A1H3M2U9_9ACTN|nr:DUF4350 domain-containing protein [Micromonospora pattaloongensis]SDY71067.1 hypothetical protein SAMN05444365_103212 [Micromonospora pattaloongensis]
MTSPTRRRWHRAAIPLGLVLLLFAVTGVTYALEHPDPREPGFLSPVNADSDGGSRLAQALTARGVDVRRERHTPDALQTAAEAPSTLLVPAPTLVHPDYLTMLSRLPATSRVVLVDPPARVLDRGGVPLEPTGRRWAARPVGPETAGQPCPLPEAAAAGVAAALRQRYAVRSGASPTVGRCYDSGLIGLRWSLTELVVIGASDPFRNDRLDEHGNTTLATGLLGTRSRVVWLDLDGPEPPPDTPQQPVTEPEAPAPPEGGDEEPYPDERGGSGGPGGPADRPDEGSASQADNPLRDAFPSWFWALLAMLGFALLIIALWRARRLAPPVAEPLPVTVRSAETVLGRGRLYRRARARGPAADILRGAALARVLPLLDLPADSPPEHVATAVAVQTGQPPEAVRELLYGATPDDDAALLRLARDLAALPHAVSAPRATRGTPPTPYDATEQGGDR